MKEKEFNYEEFKAEAIQRLKEGKGLVGAEGAFTPLIKSFLEEAMEGEIEEHLADQKGKNRKNGKGSKKVRTSQGMVTVRTPRDRDSTFNPKILPKRTKNLPNDIERQISLVRLSLQLRCNMLVSRPKFSMPWYVLLKYKHMEM